MVRRIVGAVVVAVLGMAAPAFGQTPGISVVDGKTAPVFDYDQATREHVYIPNGQDADFDGVEDRTSIEIMRPKESGPGFKVPAIIEPSPYFTSACGQFVGECIGDLDGDGINDRWPLWYDNYFVPRGYAVILAEMDGTAGSTGCATNGGPSDVLSEKAVIDWLNGRVPGYASVTGTADPVVADWHDGRAAMIGRSYNGTLPNGVAATGVEGLTTIVPISAISSWYDYSRMNGVRGRTSHYPAWLSNYVTDPDRRDHCQPARDAMSAVDGDADGNMNPFWDARNYRPHVGNVKASVFETHCLQDDNVMPNQFSEWWAGLAANGVPRKLWLCREGHVDPFMIRRAAWVDQLHQWFDHWLWGVDNGIMEQPRVDIEDTKDSWHTYADWPLPGSDDVDVYLQGDTEATPGTLAGFSGGATDTLQWTDSPNQSESTALSIASGTTEANRRVFLSPVLKSDLRLSGTPVIDLFASLDKPQSNLSAMLVDYGPSTQITRSDDGIETPDDAPSDCWGASSTRKGPDGQVMDFDACYQQPIKPTVTVGATEGWRVSRGIMDSSNRDSLYEDVPVTPGAQYEFRFPILPVDYTIPAGHRLGIVLTANMRRLERNNTEGATITMDSRLTKVTLPVVGGYQAMVAAGALAPASASQTVGGTVPATLSLTLGAPASFGAFAPGVARDYSASTTATVTSTAGDAALTVADPSEVAPGHLVNGAFALPAPLLAGGSPLPAVVRSYDGPVSNDAATIGFTQSIAADDALRTGTYGKTLTFTLSTTSP